MDNWLTTQKKDYTWPIITQAQQIDEEGDKYNCDCFENDDELGEDYQELVDEEEEKERTWSRIGPMGLHLIPQLYPARVGRAMASKTSHYNQPNAFLIRLEEKYPYLYGVLQKEAPDDLIARVNRERLRTTYMVDYSKEDVIPSDDYGILLAAARLEGISPCPAPVKLPDDKCPPNIKSRAFRPQTDVTKRPTMKREEGGFREEMFILGRSEYHDNISKLGGIIIREKLHSRVAKPGVV